jgi:catechol 2,3-dioxygenase-like lactoylglutathione lyase family enzyme
VSLQYQSAVLFVEDIERSKSFYAGTMKMKVDMDMGTNVILKNGLTLWQIDPNHIIPRSIGLEAFRSKASRFELCFETEDIEEADRMVREKAISLVHELHEEPWGQKTIRVYDPDGHIVEIGESIGSFLTRMKKQGLTLEQIAAKTGMQIQDIRRVLS